MIVLVSTLVLACTWGTSTAVGRGVRRRALAALAVTPLGALLFVGLLTAWPAWRDYVPRAWEVATGYTTMMALGASRKSLGWLAAAALGSAVVAGFAARRARAAWARDSGAGRPTLALLAAACFTMTWVRYGLTRSEDGHIVGALSPTIFLAGCLLPCYLRSQGVQACWPAVALVSWVPLVLFSGASADSATEHLLAWRGLEWQRARPEIRSERIREATDVARSLPGGSLFVWPYETVVNVLADKASPCYVVQGYVAHTEALERWTIERLDASPDVPVMLFTGSEPLDGVEHFTRNSLIVRHLLEHYETAGSSHEHFLLLRRRLSVEPRWQEQELPGCAGTFVPGAGEGLRIDLPTDREECRASDLVVLTLSAAATPSLGVRKPGQLFVTWTLSNGEERSQKLLLPQDGAAHDLLVSACSMEDPFFASFFHPQRCKRTEERVAALQLSWAPLDSLSARPAEISLRGARVLRRQGVEFVNAPLPEPKKEQ